MKNQSKYLIFLIFILILFSCVKEKEKIDTTRIVDKYLYTLDTLQEEIFSLRKGINYIIESYNKGNNLMYEDSAYPSFRFFGYYTLSKYGLLYSGTGNNYSDKIVKLLNEIEFGKGFHRKVEMEWAKYNKPYFGDGIYHDGYYGSASKPPSIDGLSIRDYIKSKLKRDKNICDGSAYISVTKEGKVSVLINEKTGSYIDTLLVNLIKDVKTCEPAEIDGKKINYRTWLYYNL